MKTTSLRPLQINTKVSCHKRSKSVKPDKLEISIKRPALINAPASVRPRRTSQAHDIARQLKQGLSDAMLRVASVSPAEKQKNNTVIKEEEDNATAAVAAATAAEPPPHRLHNMRLLKQYLLFVAQETSIDIQRQDNGDHKIVIAVGEDEVCPSAHPGARLIEAQVHSQSTMFSVLEGQASKRVSSQECRKQIAGATTTTPTTAAAAAAAAAGVQTTRKKQGNVIKCICDTPNEEFGSMVQCDDCHSWLHIECLKLTEDALEQTFQCPHCYVSYGGGQDRRASSSITWRYAARHESERMAAAMDLEMTSDDDEDDPMASSSSEAGTPEQCFFTAEDQAQQYDFFVPHASDVFLCESSINGPSAIAPSTSTSDALPSSLCSQDLLEFSFDSGPFWKPIR